MSEFWNRVIAKTPLTAQTTVEQLIVLAIKQTDPNPCVLAPIDNRTVLSITGPDSAKFMQGQFTCNLQEITDTQFRLGACCNAKGRMIANFTIGKHSDGFLMAIDKSLAEQLQAHLKKYKVFFKTEFQASNYVMAGIKGANASALLTNILGGCPTEDFGQYSFKQGIVTQLPYNAGYEVWLMPDSAEQIIEQLLSKALFADSQYWPLNLISNGLGQLTLENTEAHIPQMLNLALIGGISFNKGCYTGQEIVARMQYLGKSKRNMYLITVEGETPVGGEIFTADSKSAVGVIINAVTLGLTTTALAVIENKHIETPLFIPSNLGNSVELLSLPYNPKYHSQDKD
ncbi:MAG: folate-binding protein YgfZ [Psychrobacter glaciei]|jgi:folate-binding protein YgfZ